MKLLFIQENGMNESIGVAHLSAVIKSGGHDCDLILLSHSKDIFKDIEKYQPDVLGFSFMTGSHQNILRLIGKIKEKFPRLPNILGGPHMTFYPDVIKNDYVDMICRGEGEDAILDLLNKMQENEDISKIPNLYIRQGGTIIKNEVRPLIQDLDALPIPDRAIYYKYSFLKDVSMKRFVSSRGCPYACTFCYNSELKRIYKNKGKYLRWKSVDRLIEEVKLVKEISKLKLVTFSDDNILLNKEWLQELSLKFSNIIGLPFNCSGRFDQIDPDTAKYLKNAGCNALAVGLESGSERVRNELLKKRLSDKKIIEGAAILKDYDIKILTTNILGAPTETLDEMYMTVEMNQKIKTNFARAFVLLAFPNLKITKLAQENGLLTHDYSVDSCETGLREVVCSKALEMETKNLISLFFIAIRIPILWPVIKIIIKFPIGFILKPFELFSIYQEMRFFQVDIISGIKYFINTIEGSRGFLFGKRKSDITSNFD